MAGEMAQALRALAALAEDPGLSPGTHVAAPNSSHALSWPLRAQYGAPAYMQATLTHNIKCLKKRIRNHFPRGPFTSLKLFSPGAP